MRQLPTGTLTLLFTDIEGSTRLLQQLGNNYAEMLLECRRLLRAAFQQWNGHEVDMQGDAFFVVFERAVDAISAAVNAQRALYSARWPDGAIVRVRMGVHTGELQSTEEGYVGLDVHRAARIMSAAHGGQVLLSQTTHDLVVSELSEEVSLRDLGEYRLKDIAGLTRLFQLVVQGLPAEFPPPSTLSPQRRPGNIPSLSTSFVGREQEIAAICGQLRVNVRLLTLFGTAGVGKTRLALQVATELIDQFADGIYFVALEQFSDTDEVMTAIAQALSVQQEKGRSLVEQVKETLRAPSILLVLDNFEQVLSARLVIADLLASCPKLKVLVTSRVMLHLRAEQLFEVSPLPLPGHRHVSDLKALSHYASVALFVQRAQAVVPDFQLIPGNAAAVAGICTRLDGIPLAIELAAARTRHFSPPTLLAQLEKGLTILQGKAPDVPARQQTLRGAIAWSYDLLGSAEQRVFRRLSVFANGTTLAAAEPVCIAAGPINGSVLEVLEELVDKSMLQRQEQGNGKTRFWLLQTLREYGVERLSEAGELAATQAAHAAHFLSWVDRVASKLFGAEQADWLDQLDREYDNVRVALEWMLDGTEIETGRAEQALRLCVALMLFWEIRGYLVEGLAFMERALALGRDAAPSVRAQALHYAGFLALMQDDNTRAEAFLRESQLLFRESGDKPGMANILRLQGNLAMMKNNYKIARRLLEEALNIYRERGDMRRAASTRDALAQVAIAQCDYSRAQSLLEENLASYRALGEQYGTAYPLYHMAHILFLSRGDRAKARDLAEESLALFRAVGNRRLIAYVLSLLGQILSVDREDDRARSMLDESVAIFKVVGDRSGTTEALIALARFVAYRGKHETAQSFYKESWELLQAIGARELAVACLEGYGEVLVAQGEARWAVQLWGTAATIRAAIVAPMPPVYRAVYIQAVTSARELLSEETFQSAWIEGSRTPLEQVTLSR